ncbi:zf-HC2 domain-containing protein [Streptomyces litchfieldiae]|uniref:Zf-HC2 domain-containing protein n=1 Tax=Streptomyces litchfieldiae TaxID=3075543 RepID=A0ABU2MNH6_9ACTN|nr:zf-HC2 domain-containing protein [Streptomyces sp. DSM 44938]MDT0343175.1 zf-HC2 domain-containing protein [Streptomyces sp. DSM 44938]
MRHPRHDGGGPASPEQSGARTAGASRVPPPRGRGVTTAGPREVNEPMNTPQERPDHQELMSLLGAWALAACSAEEAERVEDHLNECGPCAEEALRLRDAALLLEPQRSLDLDPALRAKVLAGCLSRRPARLPVPSWAAPFDAEAARLDALLNDMAEDEWYAPVELRWFADGRWTGRDTTVAGVLDHLLAVDGLLARAVGLPDPLGDGPGPETEKDDEDDGDGDDAGDDGPVARTLRRWLTACGDPAGPRRSWLPWREQTRALVRAAAERGGRAGERTLPRSLFPDPGRFPGRGGELPLSDAFLDRAFACWIHAEDIAGAVEYPYEPPMGQHLRQLVDLAARRLPGSIADRRRAGLAVSPARLTTAGHPGRTLHLEVEGAGGGHWYIPIDSPVAAVTRSQAREAVAHVALDDVVFCQLAAGRVTPEEAASGVEGDPALIHDVLCAAADLSRL